MGLYSDTIAQQAIADVATIITGVPISIEYQIQDNYDFLLIMVKFETLPRKEQAEKWYNDLKQHFSKKLPKPTKDYSWMITFQFDGKVFESVMDDIVLHG